MKFGIRAKIILLVVALLGGLCTAFIVLIIHEQQDRHDDQVRQVDLFIHNSSQRELDRIHDIYQSRLDGFVSTNSDIVDAFIQGDRGRLNALVVKKFSVLKKENRDFFSITFIQADGIVMLRTARPDMYGDSALDIPFVARSFELKQPQYGLTIARWGLAYRLSRPVFEKGQFKGLIVFVLRPLSGLNLIQESLGVDSGILIEKQYQQRINGASYPVYGDYLLMEEKGCLFSEFPQIPDKERVGNGLMVARGNDHYLFYSPVELRNFEEKIIGYIQPVSRHTVQYQKHVLVLKKALGTAVVLMAVTCGVLYFGIGFLLKRVEQLHSSLENRVKVRTEELHHANKSLKHEIKQREQIQQKLERLSRYDGLTELINRRRFDELLDIEWRNARRYHHSLTVLMIDVDYFKSYNDCYGHLQGDQCLVQLAGVFKKQVKRAREIVARYGGEEFICLLPETDLAEGKIVAQAVLEAVRAENIVHRGSACDDYVTVSIGVSSMIPSETSSPDLLVLNADKALYQAKQQGRNQVDIAQGVS